MRKVEGLKKSLFLVLLASVLVLSACGNQQAKDLTSAEKAGKPKIAVLLPGPTGYFVAVKEGIDNAAREFNVEVIYADAQWDASKQLSQVEDFIAQKIDMIAVCSVDAEAIKPGVKAANDAGIPIMAFTNAIGSDPSGWYDGLVTYVGQSDLQTGMTSGKMAKELLGEKGGNVVMIEGVPGTNPQRCRKEGFNEAIKENPNIKVVYNQTSNWEKEQALKIVEDLIQKKMDFNLVYCQDDNSAIGAGMALKEAGLKDKVFVIGTDGSKDGLQAIKDGLIDRTSWKSAKEEGYKAIEACAKHLRGESVEPVIELVQVEVNPENVDSFVGEW